MAALLSEAGGISHPILQAESGPHVLQLLNSDPFQLLITNIVLPEVSCLEFIQRMRALHPQMAILVLTTDETPEVLSKMIEAGANDYLVKPFERAGFLSRVRGLLKRFQVPLENQNSGKITLGNLTLNSNSFDAYCGEERVHLTPSEFKLVHSLAIHRGDVLTREQLITLVQGEGIAVIDRAIDTHVFGLRKKLGACGEAIETVRGVGYRIKV